MSCSALLYGRFADSHQSRFQASKCANIGSAVMEGGRSADIHEFCFQGAKITDMGFDEQQGNLFADSVECYFHALIGSDKSSTLQQECRIADFHE